MYVLGNWKMNGSPELLERFTGPLTALQGELSSQAHIGLIPPAGLLGKFPPNCEFMLGAQDVSEYEDGAYTGETSASLLKALGCKLALVGHSERRQLFGESSARVAAKASRALKQKLTPVICLGETWEQREAGDTWQVLTDQLAPVQQQLQGELARCIIAYEPVWAIGTGKTASPEQAQEVHAWIREKIGLHQVALLYGGSVKPENADELFAQKDINGGLIGGASLDIESFEKICRAGARQNK